MVGSYTISFRSLDGLLLAWSAKVHVSTCSWDLWYFADPWGSGSTFCAWTGTTAFFSWEVAQSLVSSAHGERPSPTRVQRRRAGEARTVRRDQAVPFLS
jgi:hypothetical protein